MLTDELMWLLLFNYFSFQFRYVDDDFIKGILVLMYQ